MKTIKQNAMAGLLPAIAFCNVIPAIQSLILSHPISSSLLSNSSGFIPSGTYHDSRWSGSAILGLQSHLNRWRLQNQLQALHQSPPILETPQKLTT